MIEIIADLVQIANLHHFQRIHFLDFTHTIVGERARTNLQYLQLGAFFHTETARLRVISMVRKAVLPNNHSVQFAQPNQLECNHETKTVVSDLQDS